MVILQVNVIDQHVVQGDFTLESVFLSKLIVLLGFFLLSLVESCVRVAFFVVWLVVEKPFDLLLNIWVKSRPFIFFLWSWELPEDFGHLLEKNWISVNHYVH